MQCSSALYWLCRGPAADIKVTTSDLRSQVGRIQNQVKEIQEVVRMYSSTTGPRRVRRQKMEMMSPEPVDTNVRGLISSRPFDQSPLPCLILLSGYRATQTASHILIHALF